MNLSLENLQQQFSQRILHSNSSQSFSDSTLAQSLMHGHRFRMYVEGYPLRVEESLRETFPKSIFLLGEDLFAKLLQEYISVHSFSAFDLFDCAKDFPMFLNQIHESKNSHCYLLAAQMSWVELKCAISFHSQELSALSQERFLQIMNTDPEGWKPTLQPFCHVLESKVEILKLVQHINQNTKNSAETNNFTESELQDLSENFINGEKNYFLILRSEWTPRIEKLDASQFHILQSFQIGLSLGSAIESLDENATSNETEDIGAWLLRMVIAKTFCD